MNIQIQQFVFIFFFTWSFTEDTQKHLILQPLPIPISDARLHDSDAHRPLRCFQDPSKLLYKCRNYTEID